MQKSLYDRLGGQKAVSDIIQGTYDKVLVDDMIGKHFDNTDVLMLMDTFKNFFGQVFKQNNNQKLIDLKEAHRSMGLKFEEFQRFFECMFKTMEQLKLNQKQISDVKKIYYSFKSDIVTA